MKDENDKLNDGTLPEDPSADAAVVSAEVPRVLTVRDLISGAVRRTKERLQHAVCTSGHVKLDDITGGLKPGFVWTIGAATSWGKSSLLVMIADENIRSGKRVLIVTAEDSEQIYSDRLLLRRSRVNANRLRQRKLTTDEQKAVADVERKAEDSPVFLDARGRSVEWLAPRVKRLIVEHRIHVVAFDYIQAFDNQKAQQDRRNQLSYIARVLTDVTKTAVPGGIAGILFSQITESESKQHPDKNSIRDSRDVSHAAEVVLLGFTPQKAIDSQKHGRIEPGTKVLFADKVKDGPRGALLPVPWNEESACFDTVEDPEAARYAPLHNDDGFQDGIADDFDARYP